MQFLIDTHALIWYARQDANLPPAIRTIIEQPGNTIHVSIASFYEIAIKLNIGKLELGKPLNRFYTDVIQNGLHILPISERHLTALVQLPQVAGHRDPFDRLLIATAIAEEMTILTADSLFHLYSDRINVIW
jgi:PIN domain nuclease of toxin-antitoxin system